MDQLTVKELYLELGALIKAGMGDKFLVVADDNEGNSFHGMFFGCTADKENIEAAIGDSNGLYDSIEKDLDNIVIIG